MFLVAACATFGASAADGRGPTTFTGCGWAYEFDVGRTTLTAGGCVGILPRDPAHLTMRVNRELVVHIASELSNGRLDYPVPTATSNALRFLGRLRNVARYQATHAAQVRLLAMRTPYCQGKDPRVSTCVVLDLRING